MIQKSFTGKSSQAGTRSYTAGQLGEDLALRFLTRKGYRLMERNFRIRGGEIDLIMEKDGILVFVEVKLRQGSNFGPPEEALTPVKIRRLLRAICHYRSERPQKNRRWRCDCIAIEMTKPRTAK
ncbi:MAG TPA: YraN family protein, partial [Candidatus Gracilibacteria bacterium]|nr:YraN family protein [Candidatus Gracilibacteria bacterium]